MAQLRLTTTLMPPADDRQRRLTTAEFAQLIAAPCIERGGTLGAQLYCMTSRVLERNPGITRDQAYALAVSHYRQMQAEAAAATATTTAVEEGKAAEAAQPEVAGAGGSWP